MKKYRNDYFFILLALSCIAWGVFYSINAGRLADIRNHTDVAKWILGNELQIRNSYPHVLAYPLYHIVQKTIVFMLGLPYETGAVIVICLSNVMSVLLYRKLLVYVVHRDNNSYFTDLLSFGTVFFMPARSWLTNYTFYELHTGANPLHNPTILFVRPFAIMSVLFFLRIIRNHEQGVTDNFVYMGFLIVNLISVFAKPSFALVYFAAFGIVCMIEMIQRKDFGFGIKMLMTIMPSMIALIWQWIFTRCYSDSMNLEFLWGGFTGYNTFEIIKVTFGVIPTAIILIKKTQNKGYWLCWIAFVIGWIQMFTITNGPSGDFSWGFMLSMQFLTAISIALYFGDQSWKNHKIRGILGLIMFVYQIIVGMQYFRIMYLTGEYWI